MLKTRRMNKSPTMKLNQTPVEFMNKHSYFHEANPPLPKKEIRSAATNVKENAKATVSTKIHEKPIGCISKYHEDCHKDRN